MKAVFEMNILRIKDIVNDKMVEIDDNYINDMRFVKAMAKHTDKICSQLEKFYKKHNIEVKLNYHFAKKDG